MNDLRIRRQRRLVQCALAANLCLVIAVAGVANAKADLPNSGQWLIAAAGQHDSVQFTLRASSSSATGHDDFELSNPMRLDNLTGLSREQLDSGGAHVSFRLIRDPGTFVCDGWVAHFSGGGTFAFAPSPAFAAGLGKRGIDPPSGDQTLRLALGDIDLAFIDKLNAEGYARPTIGDLVRLGEHGVSMNFLNEMDSFGYRFKSVDDLIRLRDHGVDGAYLRGLATLGYKNITADDAVRARDHGVDAGFISGLQKFGYAGVSLDELVRLRDHGVDGDYVKKLAAHGYTHLSVPDLIRLRDSGI
jgi:hypothetical protein